MRSKLLQFKNLLSACLLALLMIGMTVAGLSFVPAKADGEPSGTINALMTYDTAYYTVDGSNATVIQVSPWAYLRYPVTEYVSGDIKITVTPSASRKIRILLFETGTTTYCEKDIAANVQMTADEPYEITFDPTKYFTPDITDAFDISITFADAAVDDAFTFSAELVKHVEPENPPKVEIGDFTASSDKFTVEKDGSVTAGDKTYTGLKVSWTKELVQYTTVSAAVTDFTVSKPGKLRISFYNDTAISLGVWNGTTNGGIAGTTHVMYEAGYHTVSIDVSAVANVSSLNFYFDNSYYPDNGPLAFEGTKTVVFDQIVFYNDSANLSKAQTGSDLFTLSAADGKLALSWNAVQAVGAYPYVTVPVELWQPFSRYIVFDATFGEPADFRLFFNDGKHLDDWNNPVETSAFTQYVTYEKGRHLLCFDTAPLYEAGLIGAGADNKVYIYCYGGAEAEAVTKTATFNSIRFSETEVEPLALTLDVDYRAGTVDFDDAKIEVSESDDFGTTIAKGGNVTPGTLYVRSKADADFMTEIELKSAVLTEGNAPQPLVTNKSISYRSAAEYEFKFGDDGTWGETKSWDNLNLNDAPYKIYIRKLPGDTAFGSNEISVMIDLNSDYIPVSIDMGSFTSRNDFISVSENGGKTTLSYNAAGIGGGYYCVSFPVTNWKQSNRYLIIDMTVTENTQLRFYLNDGSQDEWGNPVDSSAFTPDYPEYGKGRHLICFDTARAFAAGVISEDDENKLIVFCDGGLNTSILLPKEITFNSIRFDESPVEQIALTANVNYVDGTIEFDSEKVEIATASDFAEGTTLESGASISCGTLYVRSKTNNTFTTEIVLNKAQLSADNAPKAVITETSISYEHLSGYEFKFGDDGEWGTTALWENLTAGTEYKIYIRIPGNENSFGSDEISVTVSTKGATPAPSPDAPGKGCGCGSSASASALGLALAALCVAVTALTMRRRCSR